MIASRKKLKYKNTIYTRRLLIDKTSPLCCKKTCCPKTLFINNLKNTKSNAGIIALRRVSRCFTLPKTINASIDTI